MELPFNYLVLLYVKMLHERNMKPIIEKNRLINFFYEIIKRSIYTINDKKEMIDNFNFIYKWDKFIEEYFYYFDLFLENVVFDLDYIDELDDLINDNKKDCDFSMISNINSTIESTTFFLEIIGVKIKKELYESLLVIDRELETLYSALSKIHCCEEDSGMQVESLVKRIKKLLFKRYIIFMDTKNLLSNIEYNDLKRYSYDVANINCSYDDLPFLINDEDFDKGSFFDDVFKKSVFTSNSLCYSTLYAKLEHQLDMEHNVLKSVNYSFI